MKEEVERIKKLVGIDHNRWEQPCTCDKCKNMCKIPCIGTPKDIEAIIDAGYADRLKETTWMVGFRFAREKTNRNDPANSKGRVVRIPPARRSLRAAWPRTKAD